MKNFLFVVIIIALTSLINIQPSSAGGITKTVKRYEDAAKARKVDVVSDVKSTPSEPPKYDEIKTKDKPNIITTGSGTSLPTNKDFNLVPTKKGSSDGQQWQQIHSTHDHGHGTPHTHVPKELPGKNIRETRPTTAGDIDNADKLIRDKQLRERSNRSDKGDK